MKIILENPKDFVIVKEQKKIISEVTIEQIIDNPSAKEVKAYTLELGILILWSGEFYDEIGQWTDEDVSNRILEFLL